ncbi:MAG: hypothetical protein GYB64_16825 [Chloroflexi bacterium]|nr:hypothetical protein [Chloroflexota bacterium]
MQKPLASLILILTLAACAAEPPPSPDLVYGLTLVPSGIDPHIHASAELGIPLRSVYDTLVYFDEETGTYVPGLATDWTISADGTVYTFTLREGVTFHDGTPFDAEAVRTSFERILEPVNNSAKAAGLLGPVEAVTVLDERTVQLTLSEPFPPLLDGLSQPYTGIASPAALADHDTATYQFNQVGTGPYRFVEYRVNDRLVLERNPDYTWAPPLTVTDGIPQVERIIFRFFPDPATRITALESGDVQVIGELFPADARRIQTGSGLSLQQVSIPGQPQQFFLNTQRPPTDDPLVRQALIIGTDRQAIASSVFEGYRPIAYGPISAATRYYDANLAGLYAFDPEQATLLLDTAGLTDTDEDGWRDRDGQPVVIKLVTPPWGLNPDVAVLLKQQWETFLNLRVDIDEVASFPMLSEVAASGDYNAIGLNFFGYDPVLINGFYMTGARLNWSGVADAELDQLLAAAQRETNPTARADLYAQIQRRIMDLALVLPITDYVNVIGVDPAVTGLRYDAQGWFPYLLEVDYQP